MAMSRVFNLYYFKSKIKVILSDNLILFIKTDHKEKIYKFSLLLLLTCSEVILSEYIHKLRVDNVKCC